MTENEAAIDKQQIIDMTAVQNQNFAIKIPEATIGDATSVQVYHEDYKTAVRDIPIAHPHQWKYKADANKLQVYCEKDGDNCSCFGEGNQKELTLNASDAVYSGLPYTGASFDNIEKSAWIAAGLDVPRICYEKTDGDSSESLDEAPTDVGTYRAKITAGDATATADFKITPKPVTDPAINVTIPSPEYNGTEKTPTITVKDGSKVLVKDADYTLSGNLTGTNVNEYSVTITGKGNYGDTVDKTWKIKEGTMTGLQENNYSDIYDGTGHSATVTVATPSDVIITYCETVDGEYTPNPPSYTAVGNYPVYYMIEKEGYETLTGTLSVIISAKPQHSITLENDSHGTASASVEGVSVTTAESGKEVTLTASPNEGYKFKQWVVSSGEITITDNKFTMPDTDVDTEPAEKIDTKVTVDRTYSRLRLRIPKTTRTTNVLKWARESGADGYVIFGNKCNTNGHTYKMVQKAVIENGKTTTWMDRKLKKGVYYKYYIKAYKLVNGKKVWIAVSKVVHSTTTGGKYGNAKSVRVNKSSVFLATGKKFTIKAKQIVKKLPILKHTAIKFESSNSKVASVSDKGVIKAKGKGVCYIYVYAQNGMYKMIKVKVK